jgi:predicted RNA-binding Zn-ribbon protein involved in translation (DUF1610 family)
MSDFKQSEDRCPTCNNLMLYETDRAVHRCINCGKLWTRAQLFDLGFVYKTSHLQFLNHPPKVQP